jgi:hypothetical protein
MSAPEIETILSQFDQLSDTYLRAEVEEAMTRQEEITPYLLPIMAFVAENPLVYTIEEHNAHVYAALLLSHFREPAAHLPIIKAFCIAEEHLVELWGDTTTETLPTMLYRTCDGSIEAIKELITNRKADQFVRCAATESLSYVVAFDETRRNEVIDFLQGLFTGEEADSESHFWGNLVATLCDLHPGESMEKIRQAFADGIVKQGFIALEDVERANDQDLESTMEKLRTWVTARMPADIHGYISWFAEFNQEGYNQPAPPPSSEKKDKAGTTKKSAGSKKKTSGPKNKDAKKSRKKNRR